MSTAFPQGFVQADRLIRRRYVQIPRKQKDLLERPDAWSENLSHGPRGMINVPPEVLQDVKDFHARKHSKLAQQPNFSRPASSAGSVAPPKSSRSKQPLFSPRLGQDDQAGDDEATQLSWSPSPSRSPPGGRPVQPTEQPGLASPPRNQPASQSTLLKMKTPPITLGVGPPSSTAQSDALPYEPLSILGEETHPPVNRGANPVAATQSILPAATPPSAQGEVIPSTFMNTGQVGSVAARPFNKRRRIEDVELSDKEHDTTVETRPPPQSGSKPRSVAPHKDRDTSSASVSTPSFPSQAAVEQHQHSALLQTASAVDSNEHSSSHYTPTYEGRPRGTSTQQKNVLRQTASGSSMAPAPAQPPAEPTGLDLVKESQLHVGNTIGQRTPYEEFKAAYPDYEESTRAFIRACLAVERLESERALPEFLYDDFVRVHSTVYMDYYGEAQIRKYNEVLKATQWYNENVKDMVYTKKIIRRDNLSEVLKAHSTAVRQIRESIRAAIEAPPSTDDANSNHESDEDMADDGEQVQGEELGSDESEPEDIPGARLSPEFHVPSPGPAVTARPAMVENDELGEIGEPAGPLPAPSRKTQHAGTAEEGHLVKSPLDNIAAPEDSHRSRASPELSFHEPEAVLDGAAPLKEVTQGFERTPPGRRSPKPGQSRRDAPTPANSTPKSGTGQRKLLAPLPSSTPSSVTGSFNRPAKDKAISPPTRNTARQSSPAFRSQAESSDEESDSFDPPVAKAVIPPSRAAESDVPAFLTQAQSVYEIPGTPDRLSEEPMPPPPPQSVERTRAAPQPRKAPGQTGSTATTATALKPDEAVQKKVPAREGAASRLSISSSMGARNSPAPSDRSRASVPWFKKRVGETDEERSKRLKEHIRKRLSGKTPQSTPASTK
ncbi:hypothetical protein INS49_002232 [Diaporthe citri]|uniref:uncharacterized protein n=1 Tax=Diaporthe citri TaxID=83186 RepID=UPI001C7FEF65|nr:uncharacterized protein INS49_002232 [Diaporthe citri]KAG6368032.1 hypothetical protein INS49_002232 [Diaporthe citri]